MITPEALLSGWRGRRFLLELALAAEAFPADRFTTDTPLALAVMSAAHALDPGQGQMVVSFSGPGPHEMPPTATAESVATLLETSRLADVDQGAALRVLADAVANARYWQEPDGSDVLAAMPVVRAALGRMARHVAASVTGIDWWSAPLDRADQHAVTWEGGQREQAPRAADRLARWRSDIAVQEARARAYRLADPEASWSGEWWSTPPSDLLRTTRSLDRFGPVGVWLVEDAMSWERAVTHRVATPAGARVYEIDGPGAWAALCRAYPLEVTEQKRHDWYSTTGRYGRWLLPDWSAVAVDHDAVHLTAAAYLAAAGTAVPVEDDIASVIAGWNPDETYWLSDDARPGEDGAVWVRADQDWVPGA
ncbi:hypothetical protein ACFO6V_09400 [Promicromonospora alba]|uniref:DUF4253 domain-containing protein n=1 Tax=Promicromonospora alba TaxID=1616110 RepID=A0ABV9HHY8_9MICO